MILVSSRQHGNTRYSYTTYNTLHTFTCAIYTNYTPHPQPSHSHTHRQGQTESTRLHKTCSLYSTHYLHTTHYTVPYALRLRRHLLWPVTGARVKTSATTTQLGLWYTRYCFTSKLLCTNQSLSFYCPLPPALPALLQCYSTSIAQYTTPPRPPHLDAMHNTILVRAISCKGRIITYVHSSHAQPLEALVGELERELVKTVG